LSWHKIASELLITNTSFEHWKISIPELSTKLFLPKILKLTLKLLEKTFSSGKNRIIIIYPEDFYLPSLTVVFQTISNILSGRLGIDNNFYSFESGQKLKLNNKIYEFCAIEYINNIEMFCVKLSDGTKQLFPLDRVPSFQKIDTKRRASSIPGKIKKPDDITSIYDDLKEKRTFLKESIVYVSSSRRFTDIIEGTKFDNQSIEDILFLGKIDFESKIKNISKGQCQGNPAVLISNDLYALCNLTNKNIQMIFIDGKITIENQLDALDNLIKENIPIVVISDQINSFDLKYLEDRNFLTLRWDENSMIPILDERLTDNINQKIINCCNKRIDYIQCENPEISNIWNIMRNIRNDMTNNANQTIIDLYWQLYNIVLSVLHRTISISIQFREFILSSIDEISKKIKTQSYNISSENIKKLTDIFCNLEYVLNENYQLKKSIETESIVFSSIENNIVIIPDNEDKSTYISHWNNIIDNKAKKKVIIMYAQEYANQINSIKADVIVCGWLGKNKMKNILFSNNESNINILLNTVELQWKKSHISEWNRIIMSDSRREFDKHFTSVELETTIESSEKHEEITDDIDEINIAIQKNRYIKYYVEDNTDNSIDAVPITFVSGYFSFYKKSSDIITVTEIINNISDDSKTVIKPAVEVQIGDFVVIRETERSLIRELADEILNKEGKKEYREISGRWKNKLLEKCKYCSVVELHNKIKREGSTIGLQAFRSWINNDDFIAPQDKDNLLYIATALNDNYLINNIDKIYDVCKYVKASHVRAGNDISSRLKRGIADSISELPDIKRTDIWDPIDMNLDELGKVKILKVTNIGDPITVDLIHTNRLLTESPREKFNIEGRSTRDVYMDYELGLGDCKAKGYIPDENKIYRRIK